MRMLLLYILLVAFGCQQTTVNGQQTPFLESENLKNSESEKSCEQQAMSNEPFSETEKSVNISEICGNEKTNHKLVQKKSEKGSEPRAMSNEQKSPNVQSSQHEAQSLKKTVDYYESQIRLADSLYKNYLPQYNFDEVKKAVEFFDSLRLTTDNSQQTTDFFHRFRINKSSQHLSNSQTSCTSDAYPKTVDRCPLSVDIEYQRARAHYYHAVGLTERNDIVGACEHYFIALEIMELEIENLKTSKSGKGSEQRAMSHEQKFRNAHSSKLEAQSPDYEKIRFIALIYTRLGRLFLNENYCDLAILKYKKALKYVLLLGENKAVADTYKCLGNSYQLYNMPDSALYYYNKSLETNSELPNRLDVEKCIAQILFDKGEKDSVYVLLKNNLREIDNGNLKYSYYYTLGNMYFNDKKYDSALYYLETSLDNDIVTKKVAFTTKLSAIYDSLGDYDKRDYYDNYSAKMLLNHANKEVDNKQLQVLYDNYKERKYERGSTYTKKRTVRMFSMVGICVVVIIALLLIYMRYNYRKQSSRLKNEIDDYRKNNDKKDEIIEMQNKELQNLIKEKECCRTLDFDAYYNSDICKSILDKKEEKYIPLSVSELSLLLDAANDNLDNLINKLMARYPKLNTDDMYYICLIMLNVSKSGLSYLLNRSRKTIWERTKRIKTYMNLGDNDDLFLFLKNNEWCK